MMHKKPRKTGNRPRASQATLPHRVTLLHRVTPPAPSDSPAPPEDPAPPTSVQPSDPVPPVVTTQPTPSQPAENTDKQPLAGAAPEDVGPGVDDQYLVLQKAVQGGTTRPDGTTEKTLVPGQSFTYEVKGGLLGGRARLHERGADRILPNLDGFKLEAVEFLPANSLVTYAWYEGDTELPSRPDYFGPETRLVIRDADPNGFNNGTDFTVLIRAQVPEDFSPVDPRNNTWLTNRAEITASNSLPAEDEAHVRVQAEAKVSAGITKSWTPATQPFGVGSESTISINAFNSSNIPVDRLIVTDPAADTPNGASLLSQSNPFRLVNFGGFDASSSSCRCGNRTNGCLRLRAGRELGSGRRSNILRFADRRKPR